MRYRIQIQPMMDCVVCVVTSLDDYNGRLTSTTKMYTLSESEVHVHRIDEVLAALANLIGESAP